MFHSNIWEFVVTTTSDRKSNDMSASTFFGKLHIQQLFLTYYLYALKNPSCPQVSCHQPVFHYLFLKCLESSNVSSLRETPCLGSRMPMPGQSVTWHAKIRHAIPNAFILPIIRLFKLHETSKKTHKKHGPEGDHIPKWIENMGYGFFMQDVRKGKCLDVCLLNIH